MDQIETTNFTSKKVLLKDQNDWGKNAIKRKREGRYLGYSGFSVSDGRRRATDRRRRDLTVSALLPRLLSYRRQEGVTAASRHLTHHARKINRKQTCKVDWERLIICNVFFLDRNLQKRICYNKSRQKDLISQIKGMKLLKTL